jgi:hypothetical protein
MAFIKACFYASVDTSRYEFMLLCIILGYLQRSIHVFMHPWIPAEMNSCFHASMDTYRDESTLSCIRGYLQRSIHAFMHK